MSPLLQCPKCRAWLLGQVFNQPAAVPCRACGSLLHVEVFPALFRKIAPGESAQPVLVEGESSCFYHPQKKAVRPCDGCGRFLCALCDCELHGNHYCPACLETGKSKGKISSLEHQRTRYDSIALALSIFPLLFYYLTFITAPMALFTIIRHWNGPQSIVHRSRFRFILAGVLSLAEIGVWISVITAIVMHK